MSWNHLETGSVNGLPLDLYAQEDAYMIRVDGLELMNSHWPRSERALARIAGWCANVVRPRILIGGLGLGFTLAEVLEEFQGRAEVTVAEKSPDVLRWYAERFRRELHGSPNDSGVAFVNADVADVPGEFDLILLDVDNGPEPVSGESNGALYTSEGLLRMRERLRSGGALLLWSAFASDEFANRARVNGYAVHVLPVQVGLREHEHYVYCLFPDGVLDNHRFLQAACYPNYVGDYADDEDFVSRWLAGAERVLEVGVGTGRLARKLAVGRKAYVGLDPSAPMLHQLLRNCPRVEAHQAGMDDFELGTKFDRILFPYRVLPYCRDEDEIVRVLRRAARHLSAGGRILLNMLDFDEAFVRRWHGQSVSYDFAGLDQASWNKTDVMRFEGTRMLRRIELRRNGVRLSEHDDSLLGLPAARLRELCARAGLEVLNTWPAYAFSPYEGKGEYVLEVGA